MASALLRLAARGRRGAGAGGGNVFAALRALAPAAARGFAADAAPGVAHGKHTTPSKYGPSASWITAGMLLRMRRPRAATSLGGRWAEGCLTVRRQDTVAHAVRLMAAHEVGCLVVLDAPGDSVAGIITERSYSRKLILEGRSSDTTRVEEVMKTAVVCVNVEEKLDAVAEVFSDCRIRHLPVVGGPDMVNKPGSDHILGLPAPVSGLRGVLSVKDVAWMLFCIIRNELHGRGIGSITVRDIMARMQPPPTDDAEQLAPYTIREDRSVLEAIQLMARLGSHALVAVDTFGGVCGVLTERDYVSKVKLEGRTSTDMLVREAMTPQPWCASLDFTLDDVLTVLTSYGFRHMPIVGAVGDPAAGGGDRASLRPRCLGLLSVVDILRTIVEWPDRPIQWPDNAPPLPGPTQ